MIKNRKGVVPRIDTEAMEIMNTRETKRSDKEDLNTRQIIDLLKTTSIDWSSLAAAVMPVVAKAIVKDGKIAELKAQTVSNLKDFSKLIVDEVDGV